MHISGCYDDYEYQLQLHLFCSYVWVSNLGWLCYIWGVCVCVYLIWRSIFEFVCGWDWQTGCVVVLRMKRFPETGIIKTCTNAINSELIWIQNLYFTLQQSFSNRALQLIQFMHKAWGTPEFSFWLRHFTLDLSLFHRESSCALINVEEYCLGYCVSVWKFGRFSRRVIVHAGTHNANQSLVMQLLSSVLLSWLPPAGKRINYNIYILHKTDLVHAKYRE